MSSRTRAYALNLTSNTAHQVLVLAAGLIVPRVLIGTYGSEINGLVASIRQFINYFGVVEAGITASVMYALYGPLFRHDAGSVDSIMSAAARAYRRSGYVFATLVGVLAILYPIVVKAEHVPPALIPVLVLVLGSQGFADFFISAKYRALLTADQRLWVVSLASAVFVLLNSAIVVGLALVGVSVVVTYAVATVAVLTRTVMIVQYCKRRYPHVHADGDPDTQALSRRWDALYQQVLNAAQASFPLMIVTVIVGNLKQVSVLAVYLLVASAMVMVINLVSSGLQASFGQLIAAGDIRRIQSAYKEFEYLAYSATAVVVAVGAVTFLPFVSLYTKGVTDIDYRNALLGLLCVLDVLLYHAKTPQGLMVLAAGMYKETRAQVTAQMLILVIGGAAMTYQWGLVGMVGASCLANLYRTIDLLVFVPRRITGLPIRSSAYRVMRMVIGVLIVAGVITTIQRTSIVSWTEWLLLAIGALIAAVLVNGMLGALFDRAAMIGVVRRVNRVLQGRS